MHMANLLYRTQYGSRLFGTNTENSDTDWKSIYVPELSELVLGHSLKNVVQTTGKKNQKNTKEDIDIEFIPIQCFFMDLFENKSHALDLFMSILDYEVFHMLHPHDTNYAQQQFFHNEANPFLIDEFLRMIAEFQVKFLTTNIKPIVGFAISQASRYSVRGAKLIELEKLKVFLEGYCNEKGKSNIKLSETDIENFVLSLNQSYIFKDTFCCDKVTNSFKPCINVLEAVVPYSASLNQALETVNARIALYGSRVKASTEQSETKPIDWKSLHHAFRFAYTAIHFLKEGRYSLPFKEKELDVLMMVKKGQVDIEWAKEELELMLSQIALLEQKPHPSLKLCTPELREEFTTWLRHNLTQIYQKLK